MGQLTVGGRVSKRVVLNAINWGVLQTPCGDPGGTPEALSPLGGSYADMGQKLPEKGCGLGGAERQEGPALRDGCRPDWGFQTSLVKQNTTGPSPSFHLGNCSSSSRPSSFAHPLPSQLCVPGSSPPLPCGSLQREKPSSADVCHSFVLKDTLNTGS